MSSVWAAGFEPAISRVQGAHVDQATPHPDNARLIPYLAWRPTTCIASVYNFSSSRGRTCDARVTTENFATKLQRNIDLFIVLRSKTRGVVTSFNHRVADE